MEALRKGSDNLYKENIKEFRSLCQHHDAIAGKYSHALEMRGGKAKTRKKDEEEEVSSRESNVTKIYHDIKDEALKKIQLMSTSKYPDFSLIMNIVTEIVFRKRISINQRDLAAVTALIHKGFMAVSERSIIKLHPIFSEGSAIDRILKEYSNLGISLSPSHQSRLSALARSISINFSDPVSYLNNTMLKFSSSNPPSIFFVMFMQRLPGIEDLTQRIDYARFVQEAREGRISEEFVYIALLRLSDTARLRASADNDEVLRIEISMTLKSLAVQFREGNMRIDHLYEVLDKIVNINNNYGFNEADIYHTICQTFSYSGMLIGDVKNCQTYQSVKTVPIVEFTINSHIGSLLPTINTTSIGSLSYDMCSNRITVIPPSGQSMPYNLEYQGNMSSFLMNESLFPNIATKNTMSFLHVNGLITFYIKRFDNDIKTPLFLTCPNPCKAKRVNLTNINIEEELVVNNRTYRLVGAVCLDLGASFDGCGTSCDNYVSQNDIIGTIGFVRAEGPCSSKWLEYRTEWTSTYIREQIERVAKAQYDQTSTYSSFDDYKKDACSGFDEIRKRFLEKMVYVTDIEVPTSYAMSTICERGVLLFYSEGYESFARSLC